MATVQSVLGPIDTADLGPTLVHEHIRICYPGDDLAVIKGAALAAAEANVTVISHCENSNGGDVQQEILAGEASTSAAASSATRIRRPIPSNSSPSPNGGRSSVSIASGTTSSPPT